MNTNANIYRKLGVLSVFMFCGLASQAWAVELPGDPRGSNGRSQPAELRQPVSLPSATMEAALQEEPGLLRTASLSRPLDSTGTWKGNERALRTIELDAVFSRSSLHLGPDRLQTSTGAPDSGHRGTTVRSFACNVQILPIPLTLAGPDRTDGFTLVAF